MSPVRSVEDPRLPYRMLTWLLGVASVLCLLLAFAPASGDSVRRLDTVAAVVLAVGALLVHLLGERLPNGLALDLGVGLCIAVMLVGTVIIPTASGQLLVGAGFVMLGVFNGYFRPPRRAMAFLVVTIVGYATALLVNQRLDAAIVGVIMCLVIATVTVAVTRLVSALRAMALRDSLTGVLNRRGLDLVAEPLAAAAARSGQPITVGLIDIDSFKSYNDEHGHLAGDLALVTLVDAWRGELRASDVLARYGGDEFALVLPGTRHEDADELATRLADASSLRWTAGFVEWTPQEDLYAALGRADTLMFDRKPKRR